MLKKSCIYSITLLFVFLCNVFPVQAKEVDQAATFTEMKEWIKAHKKSGGTLQLTDDIVIDETYTYMQLGPIYNAEIVIDCGEHTIYVEDSADFTYLFHHVSFQGINDIFHVRKGAYLAISQSSLTSLHGKAIVQEEGSRLIEYENNISSDSIQYAIYPVIQLDSAYKLYHTYRQYEPADVSDFADEQDVEVFYQGNHYQGRLAITWQIEDLNDAEDLNRYYVMGGSFQGALSQIDEALSAFDATQAYTVEQPKATAIWTKDGISIYDIKKASSTIEDWLLLSIDALQPYDRYELYLRTGEDDPWELIDDLSYNGLFVFQIHGPCSFYVKAIQEDQSFSSNIITYDGQIFESAISGGGNRGGGINLLPEDEEDSNDSPILPPVEEPDTPSYDSSEKPDTPSIDTSKDPQVPDKEPSPSLDDILINPEPEGDPIIQEEPIKETIPVSPIQTALTQTNLSVYKNKNQQDSGKQTLTPSNDPKEDSTEPVSLISVKHKAASAALWNQPDQNQGNRLTQIVIGLSCIMLVIMGSVWMFHKRKQ